MRSALILAATGQILCMVLIPLALVERQVAVRSWLDFIARHVFSLISQIVIIKDLEPYNYSMALIKLNFMTDSKAYQSFFKMIRTIQMLYNSFMCCIIPYYIMTIDAEGEEGYLDLLMNFSALYIMCEIDQIIAFKSQTFQRVQEEILKIDVQDIMKLRFKTNLKESKCVIDSGMLSTMCLQVFLFSVWH